LKQVTFQGGKNCLGFSDDFLKRILPPKKRLLRFARNDYWLQEIASLCSQGQLITAIGVNGDVCSVV
jgi:hypothetical protein